MPTPRRRDFAVERGVGEEQLEIFDRRPLESRFLGRWIACGRTEKYLPESEINFTGEVRNHAAHMVGNDLQRRHLIENSRIDKAVMQAVVSYGQPKLNQISFSDACSDA